MNSLIDDIANKMLCLLKCSHSRNLGFDRLYLEDVFDREIGSFDVEISPLVFFRRLGLMRDYLSEATAEAIS